MNWLFIIIPIVLVMGIAFGVAIGFIAGVQRGLRMAGGHQGRSIPKWLGPFLVGSGGLCLLIALFVWLHDWHFTRTAKSATGTVIEMLSQTDKDGDTAYAPTFRFPDSTGESHTVSSRMYESPPAFHIGDKVPVLYLEKNPETASINRYWQVFGGASILAIVGGLDLVIGLGFLCWPAIRRRSS